MNTKNRDNTAVRLRLCFFLLASVSVLFGLARSQAVDAQESGEQPTATQSKDRKDTNWSRQQPFQVRPFSPVADEFKGRGISYGPFRQGQRPGGTGPTRDQIQQDLQIIAQDGWQMIRTYGTEPFAEKVCDVIRSQKLPIRLMLGAWIATEKDSSLQKQSNQSQVDRAIQLANQYPDVVAAVSVANESQVFWSFHKVEPDTLVQYVRQVRAAVKQPVTVADDFKYWTTPESRKLAEELDFIVMHAYAMWLGETLENSLEFTKKQYAAVKSNHPDKIVVLGEFGWATMVAKQGDQATRIKGKPGIAEQKKFFEEHFAWLTKEKIPFFYFEAFDESWKGGDDPREVEKHWGLYFENRTRKWK